MFHPFFIRQNSGGTCDKHHLLVMFVAFARKRISEVNGTHLALSLWSIYTYIVID